MSVNKETISHNLRAILKQRKIRPKDLANQLGMKQTDFNNILYGNSRKFDLLLRITEGLRITIDDLLHPSPSDKLDYSTDEEAFLPERYLDLSNQVSKVIYDLNVTINKKNFDKVVAFLDQHQEKNFPKTEAHNVIKWLLLFLSNNR